MPLEVQNLQCCIDGFEPWVRQLALETPTPWKGHPHETFLVTQRCQCRIKFLLCRRLYDHNTSRRLTTFALKERQGCIRRIGLPLQLQKLLLETLLDGTCPFLLVEGLPLTARVLRVALPRGVRCGLLSGGRLGQLSSALPFVLLVLVLALARRLARNPGGISPSRGGRSSLPNRLLLGTGRTLLGLKFCLCCRLFLFFLLLFLAGDAGGREAARVNHLFLCRSFLAHLGIN
mmetsp:Transcript_67792/g.220706  ORF Transcript_67792/g.220706 Transcript_67792/m.220706 type:complete len:232 (-) Transcript_67792:52-747(-)